MRANPAAADPAPKGLDLDRVRALLLDSATVGLAVAMPVSLVLTWFESRVENERVAIEAIASEFLNRRGTENQASELEHDATLSMPLERGHAH